MSSTIGDDSRDVANEEGDVPVRDDPPEWQEEREEDDPPDANIDESDT